MPFALWITCHSGTRHTFFWTSCAVSWWYFRPQWCTQGQGGHPGMAPWKGTNLGGCLQEQDKPGLWCVKTMVKQQLTTGYVHGYRLPGCCFGLAGAGYGVALEACSKHEGCVWYYPIFIDNKRMGLFCLEHSLATPVSLGPSDELC